MTRLSIERPLTVLMGILALVLMGAVSYTYLKVDRLPPLSFPVVNVTILYPQAAAQDVETLISRPVEDALSGLPGAQTISSTSSEGRSQVRVQFVEGANMDLSALDVERRIARIRNRLPIDAGDAAIAKADPNEFPIMNIALSGAPMDQLRDLATNQMQPALQSVLGVATVNISGGLVREVQVTLDYSKLAAYNITGQQISTALAAANVTTTVGSYEDTGRLFSMRAIGRFETPQEMGALVVAQTTAGPVLLRDVATVGPGYKDLREIQRINGEDAVGISIVKASDANALELSNNVRQVIADLQTTLPAGTNVLIRNDSSLFVRASLDAVQFDVGLAVAIVGLVTLLFLHSFRNVLIILLSIPTSMISTLLVMFALGFSLNLMTLMALALMVGILVDSSIVVVENIHRHLQMGKSSRLAALEGRNEIGLATIAIAAADIVVYVPIAFMSGGVGQLFRQYGLTVVAATIFSVLISFTLTPMLASRWMHHEDESAGKGPVARFGRWWDARFDVLARLAQRLVPVAVKGRWAIVAVCVAMVAVSVFLVQSRAIGSEYAPQEDNSNFQVTMTTPPGSSLYATDLATRQFEEALRAIPEVESVFSSVQLTGGGGRAQMTVQLPEKRNRQRSIFEIMDDVRAISRQIPGIQARPSINSALPGGGGSGRLDVDVSGPELETLNQLVVQLKAAAAEVPGLTDLQDTSQTGTPELQITLDPIRMAQLNVTAQAAIDALRTTLGGRVSTFLRPTGKDQLDVTVVASNTDRANLANLATIPVRGGAVGNNPGAIPVVTLGQIATFAYGTGPVQIDRVNRNRTITLSGTASGRSLGDVAADLKTALNAVPLPAGYSVRPGNQVNQFNNALMALSQALMLALLLEYMLLVALYQSWLQPIVLLVSVPLGLVGSLAALLITGNTISIFSIIGMIMAFGLVAKNGILLIDFTNLLRTQGVERTEALAQAARARLRPILMTSATMVFGMFPLAMKFESGAESRAPMAVVVIGAIATSTILALMVIPAVYTLFDDLGSAFSRRRAHAPAAAAEAPAAAPAPVPVPGPFPAAVPVHAQEVHASTVRTDGLREGMMPMMLQDDEPPEHGRLP